MRGRGCVLALRAMSDQRSQDAIARIEAALQRIETGLAARPSPPAHTSVDAGLVERHERLRNATRAAVAELDVLIGAR